jgi:hypothetical protein
LAGGFAATTLARHAAAAAGGTRGTTHAAAHDLRAVECSAATIRDDSAGFALTLASLGDANHAGVRDRVTHGPVSALLAERARAAIELAATTVVNEAAAKALRDAARSQTAVGVDFAAAVAINGAAGAAVAIHAAIAAAVARPSVRAIRRSVWIERIANEGSATTHDCNARKNHKCEFPHR